MSPCLPPAPQTTPRAMGPPHVCVPVFPHHVFVIGTAVLSEPVMRPHGRDSMDVPSVKCAQDCWLRVSRSLNYSRAKCIFLSQLQGTSKQENLPKAQT